MIATDTHTVEERLSRIKAILVAMQCIAAAVKTVRVTPPQRPAGFA